MSETSVLAVWSDWFGLRTTVCLISFMKMTHRLSRVVCCFVDSIEANVETAAASVEQGAEQLQQARRHQVTLLCVSCLEIGIKTTVKSF